MPHRASGAACFCATSERNDDGSCSNSRSNGAQRESNDSSRAHTFFCLLGAAAFENTSRNYSHAEVFGEVNASEFSATEAAEYLEVSVATFRRFVQRGGVVPARVVGRNQFFAAAALKVLKRARRDVKGGA